MELKNFFAQDDEGNALPGAICYLYDRGTESQVVGMRKANGVDLVNPFTANQDGLIQLAAPNGLYDLRVVHGSRDYRIPVQFNDVDETVAQAERAADRASNAADVAQTSDGIKGSIAEGMATTQPGQHFTVPSTESDEYLVLYRNDGSAATFIDISPNKAKVDALEQNVVGVATRLSDTENRTRGVSARRVPGLGFYVRDRRFGVGLSVDTKGVTNTLAHNTRQQIINGVVQIPQTKRRARGNRLLLDGNDLRSLVAVRDNGTIDFARINVRELLVGGLPFTPQNLVNLKDTYLREGEVLPYYANPLSVSGWGSSSMERMASEFANLVSDLNPSATYYSGGKGGESSTHIAGRLGSVPLLLTVTGAEIPASGGVTVTGSNVRPTSSLRAFTGKLNGVPGTVSSTGSVITFTRTSPGDPVPTVGEFPFLPDIGPQHRGDVVFLWMGKNDAPTYSAESIISRTDASFDWLSPFVKRCLVLGHFHDSNTAPDTLEAQILDEVNAAHKARYGELFVDVQAYLMSAQVWIDTGITPTAGDLQQQGLGQKPTSLSVDNGHMNAAMYKALHEKILLPLIRRLGWY